MTPVYFDHNATTPLDGRVLDAMLPYLQERHGNPSSRHEFGTVTRKAVDRAREQVAALVGVQPVQVVFTSGGTEANNLLIRGMAAGMKPTQVAVSSIEHSCVAAPAQDLVRQGWTLRKLKVTRDGAVDLADVDAALTVPTGIVSVMLAHNETGVIQDVAAVGERARRAHAVMHTDAVQALGKIEVDFNALNVQAMTLTAHKLYGPKGAGALVIDKRLDLRALVAGGGQERGLRGGTENVPAIVGFGAACELAAGRLDELGARLVALRDRFESGISDMGATVFGARLPRLPNTSFFAFKGIQGEALVIELDKAGFAVGSGAACSSANPEPPGSLLAMGVAPDFAHGAARFSAGAANTNEQVDALLTALAAVVQRLRKMTAVTV